ncbi:hypothetical protein ACWDV4_11440 [Micromonospora sp. NPDC003197]
MPAPVATTVVRREGSRRRGLTRGLAAALALAIVVLGGFLLRADGERRDQQRRAADLAVRNTAQEQQSAALRTQLAARDQQLADERARFTAVEPCLRELVAPPLAEPLTEAEKRRILEEAMRQLPPGSRTGPIEIGGTGRSLKELLPACKNVEENLRR